MSSGRSAKHHGLVCPPSTLAQSIANHGRPSGRGLLICHDQLGTSNSSNSYPPTGTLVWWILNSRETLNRVFVPELVWHLIGTRSLWSRRVSPRFTRSDARPPTCCACSHGCKCQSPHTYCASGYLTYLAGKVCKIGTYLSYSSDSLVR